MERGPGLAHGELVSEDVMVENKSVSVVKYRQVNRTSLVKSPAAPFYPNNTSEEENIQALSAVILSTPQTSLDVFSPCPPSWRKNVITCHVQTINDNTFQEVTEEFTRTNKRC